MRTLFLLVLVLGFYLTLYSCKKEVQYSVPDEKGDYRDSIVGDYAGICINTYWVDSIQGYGHDSTDVIASIVKTDVDSIVELTFDPAYYSQQFKYKYVNPELIAIDYWHYPYLTIHNDTLIFHYQPGLGPFWTDCFAIKVE